MRIFPRLRQKSSDPIERDAEPKRFWVAFGVSTALFLGLSGGVFWFLMSVLP